MVNKFAVMFFFCAFKFKHTKTMAEPASTKVRIKKDLLPKCAICLQRPSVRNRHKCPQCKQKFCKSCIDAWNATAKGGAILGCPLCRYGRKRPNYADEEPNIRTDIRTVVSRIFPQYNGTYTVRPVRYGGEIWTNNTNNKIYIKRDDMYLAFYNENERFDVNISNPKHVYIESDVYGPAVEYYAHEHWPLSDVFDFH